MKGSGIFFAAPHRVMFLAGTLQGLAAILWWTADLGARYAGLFAEPLLPLPANLPPSWLHGVLMIYAFFPFFIFGFLITAAPRWQGAEPVPGKVYVPCFLLLTTGWLGVDASFLLPTLLPIGLGLVIAGWMIAIRVMLRVARHPHADRRHAWVIVAALGFGVSGLATLLCYVFVGTVWLALWALQAGIWCFLLPVFVTVAHRMLPFFSSAAIPKYVLRRPYWALWLLLAAFGSHAGLAVAGAGHWTFLVDLPAAVAALCLSVIWRFRQSLAVRMVAVLHISFAWLAVALALYAAQNLALLAGFGLFGLAPLHALAIGFFSSMLLAMVTRVTLGHSGRGIVADTTLWLVFWGMQTAAILRVASELLPDCCAVGFLNLTWLAALAWLLAFGGWSLRFAPAYWRPRVDGRPG